MFGVIARKLFGTINDRAIKDLQKQVAAINALEPSVTALSDEALRGRTEWLRERLSRGESPDDVLADAFATVRDAARRVLGQRPFDVQLMGGIVLHQGKIAEMGTGEGKTLVATLPVYLNALAGKGVHVITVNDYLARRDSAWMGRVYHFLGLSVGCIAPDLTEDQRHAAYACDVVYGTHSEFGFDHLRDNMVYDVTNQVQRAFHYGIVDEVDSILIDEARTPLIITGPAPDSSSLYADVDRIIPEFDKTDYEVNERDRTVTLTEFGTEKAESLLRDAGLLKTESLYDLANVALVHHLRQSLDAHILYERDRDYIVKSGKVLIVDSFSGRIMEGRRYAEGLHQALEAKERVAIEPETRTLASITYQNYFRLYPKLAGMTGTAVTEIEEFSNIYNLDVVTIPTNRPRRRIDSEDAIYRSTREKYGAILKQIEDCHSRGQPVLVGTVSIEKSELLSALLKKRDIPHNVLNARHHEREAILVAQAGRPRTVTIATNMAGRGTDIQLGGNLDLRLDMELADIQDPAARDGHTATIRAEIEAAREQVRQAGGLFVIGTERHDSRRIDNQLRGRAGRQGDPGATQFFLSLEDDLLRRFGSERMDGMLQSLGMADGEAVVHTWISKAIERAQQRVEANHFDLRKGLLRFDDVINEQRKAIYDYRQEILGGEGLLDTLEVMRHDTVAALVAKAIPHHSYSEQWDLAGLQEQAQQIFDLPLAIVDWGHEEGIAESEIEQRLQRVTDERMAQKLQTYGSARMQMGVQHFALRALDDLWQEHLLTLDYLRHGINLRAHAQVEPLNEYKREALSLFKILLDRLREAITSVASRIEVCESAPTPDVVDPDPLTSRNALCPCGSGKRYKHCHGRLDPLASA
ncbi:MAG: preprotein translocase subunit SecA [Acidobacteriaceae bacterium]|nr:preprotein translocase subunit SecA [Acidobacteriaceae bacterium]